MAKITRMSARAKWILYGTAPVAMTNFVIFWVVAVYMGGDALNGFIKEGHYFIYAHGACREVAKSFWTYSYWHAISAMCGIVLVFIAAAVLVNTGDIDLDFSNNAQQREPGGVRSQRAV